jgi:hypothetical protein
MLRVALKPALTLSRVSRVDFAGQLVERHGLTERHRPEIERPLIHREAVSVYIPGPERNATGFPTGRS